MPLGKAPAVVGGVLGVLGALAAAALAQQRRVAVDRGRITASSAAALREWPPARQSRLVSSDGVALQVEEVGPALAELTVLFVHGFTLNLNSFTLQRKAILERFGDRVRVLGYDQRSHGRSERAPAATCTLQRLGEDLHEVITQLVPTGPIVLVGHSMGGMTVMMLAADHPELFGPDGRIGSVALINTSSGELRSLTLGLPRLVARLSVPVLPPLLQGAARNAALVERGRTLAKDLSWAITKRLSFADPDVEPAVVDFCTAMIAATPVDVIADFLPSLLAHDGREGLAALARCRVLVIGAEQDAMTPPEHSRALAADLPGARLVVAPRAGHLLMLEHPEVVNEPLCELVAAAMPALEPGGGPT